MSIPHKVRLGDSLWFLAHRYLGSGALWEQIQQHHNQKAANIVPQGRLRYIDDANLIFIGETIMIPGKSKRSLHGNGRRLNANRSAQGLDLKVVYKVDGPKNQYRQILPTCTIEARLSGTIAIENMSQNRHEHNYELAMGRNNAEFKHSMSQFSDHAFKDLTQGVALDYQSKRVSIQSPIMYKAGLGPNTIEVQVENPFTLKGTFKPGPISAESSVGKKKYKYTAEIQFDVTVILNPPAGKEPELDREKVSSRPQFGQINDDNTFSNKMSDIVAVITVILLGVATWHLRMPACQGASSTTIGPITHRIPMGSRDRT